MSQDKIICPWCERSFDLDQIEMADLWRERTALAARLGPAWKLAVEYCDCFRAARDARITLKRRVAILSDLAKLWESCVFEYDGRRYRTDQRAILDALHAVCSAGKYGFTNHNYLKRVLMGPERQARILSEEGLTAEEEAERELRRRAGVRDDDTPAWMEEFAKMTPEEREERRRKVAEILGGFLGRQL